MKMVMRGYLKGPFTEALRDKNEKVIEDYFSGGFNQRIAVEREANATSNGVLNVGFRNLQRAEGRMDGSANGCLVDASGVVMVVENAEEGHTTATQLEAVVSDSGMRVNEEVQRMLKGISSEAAEAATNLQRVRENYAGLVETKIECMRKECDAKAEIADKEAEIAKKDAKRAEEMAKNMKKIEESKHSFEVKKRKDIMQLLIEEAEVQVRCKQILMMDGAGAKKKQRCAVAAVAKSSSSSSSWSSTDSDEYDEEEKAARQVRKEQRNRFMEIVTTDPVYNPETENGLSEEQIAARRRLWNVLEDMRLHDLVCTY